MQNLYEKSKLLRKAFCVLCYMIMKVFTKICWKGQEKLISVSVYEIISVQRTGTLSIEIYKTINNLNPEFIKKFV